MTELIRMLEYPLVSRALIAGVLVSVCAALLGVILVLKHFSLIGHGLGDVGFAALSLSVALGLPPMAVTIPVVIFAAFLILYISQRSGGHGDVMIGMVATGALSFGVIVTALTRGFNIDVYDYMFGSILAMESGDVLLSAGLSVVVIGGFLLFYNRLFAISFDEPFAKSGGLNVSFYHFLIALLTALTVVLGMRMMGTLLISSLIIFPAVTARHLVRSFRLLVVVSACLSALCFVGGMAVSFLFNLPTGASVVLVNLCALVLAYLARVAGVVK